MTETEEKQDFLSIMGKKITTTEGPPFPTGDPHYGHILVFIIKAIIYYIYKMNNEGEKPRAGFDVNGFGIEALVDALYNPKNLSEKLALCKEFVENNIKKWDDVPKLIRRELDTDNYWATNHDYYIKSVWWAFSELYKKDLVYFGKKICPYSIGVGSNISNSEAKENTKKLPLDCIVYTYKLNNFFDAKLVVWTTTPWTIPSNTICCVGNNIKYVLFKYEGKNYILSQYAYNSNKKKVSYVNFDKSKCTIIKTFNGSELVDIEYEPIFTYNQFRKDRIYHGDFIDEQKGTGITHIVPAFGSDDMEICKKNNIVDCEMKKLFDPLDSEGNFTNLCPELEGMNIFSKETVQLICKMIKESDNLCIKSTTEKEQNVCPRTDEKLIPRATESLFIKTRKLKDRMIEFTKRVKYTSNGQQRMLQWLEDNRDWDFGRKKNWGTPIPLWESDDGEIYIPESVEELEKKCNKKINSFLKDDIDSLRVISSKGLPMKRVPYIFDCWFDSGCAPFASRGYPYKTTKMDFYPMDYIAESHDQIRGWFYSLLVLSTALFDILPYKRVFMTGMVLAEDGQKMSKRKQNYEPYDLVVKKYGSDAIKLYFTSSPVVEAGNLQFKVDDIKDCIKDVIMPLKNCVVFLNEYVTLYEKQYGKIQFCKDVSDEKFDMWLYSITYEFNKTMMDHYHNFTFKYLKNTVQTYVFNLNNWYIKFMRNTMKGMNGKERSLKSLSTLDRVIKYIAYIIKPLMPETSEELYDGEIKLDIPYDKTIINEHEILHKIVNSIRYVRDQNIKKNNKYPIKDIKIYTSEQVKGIVEEYKDFIIYEINSDELQFLEFKEDMIKKNIIFNDRVFARLYNKTNNFKNIISNYKQKKEVPEEKSYPKAFSTTYDININETYFNKYIPEIETLISVSKEQDKEIQNKLYKLRCLFSSIQKMRGTAKLHPWNKICIRTNKLSKEYLEDILKTEDCINYNRRLVESLYSFLNNEKLDEKLLLKETVEDDTVELYLGK